MDEMQALRAELEHYKTEKERIRDIVGQIGGRPARSRVRLVNFLFLGVVILAFGVDVLRHTMRWDIPYLPPLMLLEIAVLLVSLKIIWMIHTQAKVDHFQFWVLNSIEFQMNMLMRRIAELDKAVRASVAPPGGAGKRNETSPRGQ